MKNIQVIDGAENCVYDVFGATDEEFAAIFLPGQDVAFVDEVEARGGSIDLEAAFARIYRRRMRKVDIDGIHGTLFIGLDEKKRFYPNRVDEDAVNLDGSRLR